MELDSGDRESAAWTHPSVPLGCSPLRDVAYAPQDEEETEREGQHSRPAEHRQRLETPSSRDDERCELDELAAFPSLGVWAIGVVAHRAGRESSGVGVERVNG